MSRVATEARTSALKRAGTSGPVALVGGAGSRERITAVLEHEEIDLAGFDSVEAIVGCADSLHPLLVVLWIEDTVSGLTASIEPLTQSFADTPIILACSSIERWGVREALMAGAAGVVLWQDIDLALAPSIRAVLAGQACVPRGHQRQIEPPALSNREKQILGLVVMGYANGQIAQQLFLAESTVKSHLSSAFGKLGVRSRNEAVHLILDPERGLGMGILALGGEPMESTPAAEQ